MGSTDTYISEFQRTIVMVTNIYEAHLVMLYTEGLTEPLRGWVKAYQPATLQDAISRTKDLQESMPKPRFTLKPNLPTRFNDRRPPRGIGQVETNWMRPPARN